MARLQMKKSHKLAMAAVLGMEAYSHKAVESPLYELLKLRASLVNGCAYCIDMHSTALRKDGESEERISALADWPASELFTDREQAVLALTDEVTRLGEGGVSDQVWDTAHGFFGDKGMGNLVMAIATINVWNRIAISTRMDEA